MTDRRGINKLSTVSADELGWIFRELTIVDVGVDGFLEEAIDENPTGQFLAVQVKSGPSHFKGTNNKKYLRVSDTHKNYWLDMSLPIILVGFLPDKDILFWQEISHKYFIKTPMAWNLKVNFNNHLCSKSKAPLKKIITEFLKNRELEFDLEEHNKEDIDKVKIQQYLEDIQLADEANSAIVNINKEMSGMKSELDLSTVKLNSFIEQGLSIKDSVVKKEFDDIATTLASGSRKMKTEISIFSECYGIGLSAFMNILREKFKLDKKAEEFRQKKSIILDLPAKIETALKSLESLRNTVVTLDESTKKLRSAKYELLDALNIVIFEYRAAKELTESLL